MFEKTALVSREVACLPEDAGILKKSRDLRIFYWNFAEKIFS